MQKHNIANIGTRPATPTANGEGIEKGIEGKAESMERNSCLSKDDNIEGDGEGR